MAIVLTQDQLLEVVGRFIAPSYLDPIREVGPGYEFFQAVAKVGERVGLAISRLDDDAFILSAAGPARATVVVQFYRPHAGAGAVTVLAGTMVRAPLGGQTFRTTEPAVFGGADLGPISVIAESIGYGYEYNVKGQFVAPNNQIAPGEITVIDLPLQDPPFGDPSIQVRNVGDATGGRPGTLDAHGAERDLPRRPGESDGDYASRIRMISDTVSPAAILRQLERYLTAAGVGWRAVETFQHEYQECWDPPSLGPTPFENYDQNLFSYDDPRPRSPIQNRWLSDSDHVGCGIVEVDRLGPIADYGFAYDDPGVFDADFVTALGRRAHSAYDVGLEFAPPGLPPAYDSDVFGLIDFGIQDFYANLMDLLDKLKLGGVLAVVHVEE